MKAFINLKRMLLAGVVALTLGLGLAPRAQAVSSADPVMRSGRVVLPDFDKKSNDGQETHG